MENKDKNSWTLRGLDKKELTLDPVSGFYEMAIFQVYQGRNLTGYQFTLNFPSRYRWADFKKTKLFAVLGLRTMNDQVDDFLYRPGPINMLNREKNVISKEITLLVDDDHAPRQLKDWRAEAHQPFIIDVFSYFRIRL